MVLPSARTMPALATPMRVLIPPQKIAPVILTRFNDMYALPSFQFTFLNNGGVITAPAEDIFFELRIDRIEHITRRAYFAELDHDPACKFQPRAQRQCVDVQIGDGHVLSRRARIQ